MKHPVFLVSRLVSETIRATIQNCLYQGMRTGGLRTREWGVLHVGEKDCQR